MISPVFFSVSFPVEIHRAIILHIRECNAALKKCALVSTGFRDVAHEQLFRSLTLRRSWPAVYKFFSSKPALSAYVRTLSYVGDEPVLVPSVRTGSAPYIPVPPNFIFALLKMFPQAESVHFFRLEITASHWIPPPPLPIARETADGDWVPQMPCVLDTPPAVQRLSMRQCYFDYGTKPSYTSLIPHLPFLSKLEAEDIGSMSSMWSDFDRKYIPFEGPIIITEPTSPTPHFPRLTDLVIQRVPLADLVTPLIPPAPIVNLYLDHASPFEVVNLSSNLLPACQTTLRKLYIGTMEHPCELERSLRFLESHGIFQETERFHCLTCVRLSLDLPYYSTNLESYAPGVHAFLAPFVNSLPATVHHLTFIFQIREWSPANDTCPLLAIDFKALERLVAKKCIPHFQITCVVHSRDHAQYLAILNIGRLFSTSNPEIKIHLRFSELSARKLTGVGNFVCHACDG